MHVAHRHTHTHNCKLQSGQFQIATGTVADKLTQSMKNPWIGPSTILHTALEHAKLPPC